MKEILQMEMTRWILGRRLGLYNLTSRKRKPYNQPTAEGDEPPQAHARQLPLRVELTSFENIPYNSLRSRQSTLSARPF